ncbi:glycosyltransferase [Budviciaceae bacterium CWB-B4]|uniref:Glycosyltransferase n=1 Tax=Limnobaculum xujianqingii TaxID=2738837 RepID=A0A9D7AJY3_9GAMM|nr:glycosyltransferase [Limnobaculum xujianqingii]MBK5074194.1 glycosyltransferase [Limnobaculum xujianqingii]MBK5177503.1 glycosyltransferase [Limnobaculum xujianqingii]
MKRLHIINLDGLAGTEKMLIQFVNSNINDGDEDIIININNELSDDLIKHIDKDIVIFPYRIFQNKGYKYPSFIRKRLLRTLIEKEKADLIIVWDLIPNLDKKPSCGKIVYYDHGNSWHFSKNSKTLNFFSMVDGCISVSVASQRMLQLKFNLHCPIETILNNIPPPDNIKKLKETLGESIVLGTASRLEPIKAIGVAILTTLELNKRGINTTLYIAGQGSQEARLRALVKKLNLTDKVIFMGFQQDLADFYQKIDFYISSPITEAFGLSCMEALYNGIPVIFPLIDGQPEVIKTGETGLGYTPTMTFEQYNELTGLNIHYNHQGYNPLSDKLMVLKVPSYIDYADGIENIVKNNEYNKYSENALRYTQEQCNYEKFNDTLREKLNSFL